MAYALSSGGSDWVHVKLLSIDQKSGEPKNLDDKLEFVKFTSLAWTHDNKVSITQQTGSCSEHKHTYMLCSQHRASSLRCRA